MRKKKLRKKLAEAYAKIKNLQSINQSLAQSGALVSSQYESVRARLYSETNELSDRVRQAKEQNRQLEARIAYLEKIKLYGKVTASETLDASHESIAELPVDNKGTLGVH